MKRLQFRHHDNIFENRAEALNYFADIVDTQKIASQEFGESLFSEPMTVKYKDEDGNVQIIFAIGVDSGHTPYHIIDSKQIAELIEKNAQAIADETERAMAAETFLSGALQSEIDRSTETDEDLQKQINENKVRIESVTPSAPNVLEEYSLKNAKDEVLGVNIKIYKDNALVGAVLGYKGAISVTMEEDGSFSLSYDEDLRDESVEYLYLVYRNEKGELSLVGLDVERFLLEAEFKDGLLVENHTVSVKIKEGEKFLNVTSAGVETVGIEEAIDEKVAEETDRAMEAEKFLSGAILTEAERATEAEANLQKQINDNKTEIKEIIPSSDDIRAEYVLVDATGKILGANVRVYKDNAIEGLVTGFAGLKEVEKTEDGTFNLIYDETTRDESVEYLYIIYTDKVGKLTFYGTSIDAFINENEIGDGINLENHKISIKIKAGEPYLTVDADGVQTVGIDDAIDAKVKVETDRAVAAETFLSGAIQSEIERATAAEEALQEQISGNKVEIKEVAPSSDDVRQEYALYDANSNVLGSSIKVYKDSRIEAIVTGFTGLKSVEKVTPSGDEFVMLANGDQYTLIYDEAARDESREYLYVIYTDEKGELDFYGVDMEDFIRENEIGDGLKVDNHNVSIKVKDGEEFLTVGSDGISTKGIREAIEESSGSLGDELAKKIDDEIARSTAADEYISGLTSDFSAATVAEIGRIDESLASLDEKIDAETERALAAESAISATVATNKINSKDVILTSAATGTTLSIQVDEKTITKYASASTIYDTQVAVLGTLLKLKKVSDPDETVKYHFQLQDAEGNALGDDIIISNDGSLYKVEVGYVGDILDPVTGEYTQRGPNPDDKSLNFIYQYKDGKFHLVSIRIADYFTDTLFGRGLNNQDGVISLMEGDGNEYLVIGEDTIAVVGVDASITSAYTAATAYTQSKVESAITLTTDKFNEATAFTQSKIESASTASQQYTDQRYGEATAYTNNQIDAVTKSVDALSSSLSNAITTETTNRETADKDILAQLREETTNRTEADNAIREAISRLSTEIKTEIKDTTSGFSADILALSANSHTHANKDVLDGIDAEKVTDWDYVAENAVEIITINSVPQAMINHTVNIDLTPYATKEYVTTAINDAIEGFDKYGYATQVWVTAQIDAASAVLQKQIDSVTNELGEFEAHVLETYATSANVHNRIEEVKDNLTEEINNLDCLMDVEQVLKPGQNYTPEEADVYAFEVHNQEETRNVQLTYTPLSPLTLTVPETIGDIERGTKCEDLNGQAISQILDSIIFKTIYPTITDISGSVKFANGGYTSGSLREVGTTIPTVANMGYSFSKGTVAVDDGVTPSKAYVGDATGCKYQITYAPGAANSNAGVAVGGASFTAEALDDHAGEKMGVGTYTFRGLISYGQGPVMTTSKGATPNPMPTTNKGDVANPHQAGTLTTSYNVNIPVTLPVFIDNQANGTFNKQTLKTWGAMTFTGVAMAGQTADKPTQIKTPRKINTINSYNEVSGKYDVPQKANYQESQISKSINGVSCTYYLYKWVGGALDAVNFEIKTY